MIFKAYRKARSEGWKRSTSVVMAAAISLIVLIGEVKDEI